MRSIISIGLLCLMTVMSISTALSPDEGASVALRGVSISASSSDSDDTILSVHEKAIGTDPTTYALVHTSEKLEKEGAGKINTSNLPPSRPP